MVSASKVKANGEIHVIQPTYHGRSALLTSAPLNMMRIKMISTVVKLLTLPLVDTAVTAEEIAEEATAVIDSINTMSSGERPHAPLSSEVLASGSRAHLP